MSPNREQLQGELAHMARNSILITWALGVAQRNYICLNCTYVETYAPMTPKQKDLVRQKWQHINDKPRIKRKSKPKNDE